MKKLVPVLLLSCLCCCTGNRASVSGLTEPADPAGENIEAWTDVRDSHVSWGSTDARYQRSLPFTGSPSGEISVKGWRGEKLSAQLVVWTAEDIRNLECTVGRFTGPGGASFDGMARTRFVKYVLSDRFDPETACMGRPAESTAHLQPDILDEAPGIGVPARTARPVWITVEIPRDAEPGRYSAEVTVKRDRKTDRLTLGLEVAERVLPPPPEWTYHLDLWQHPAAVARVEGVPVWSDEHFRRMEPVMKMLAGAGQKVITATLNKDPWNHQCYDAYEDMIVWTRRADGTWEYDFTVFDRWIGFMLGLGIGPNINCYSMLPWNNELHYRDEATGEWVEVKADPGTSAFREMWSPFLPAFEDHLREKGWLGSANIAMDERSPETMREAASLLAEAAPGLGIALADNHGIFKQYPYIKDMCAGIFGPIDPADIADRRGRGLVTTYYVCCSSDFPNTYTSSDPAEAVYLSWYAAAAGYDGFLRWSYNSWTEDPMRDARFTRWASGDTFMVYPGGRSSIRFERLAEGIQDWEKITILRAELAGNEDTGSKAALSRLNDIVSSFGTYERVEGWNERLNEAKRFLNSL